MRQVLLLFFSRQDIAPMSYIDVEQKKNPAPEDMMNTDIIRARNGQCVHEQAVNYSQKQQILLCLRLALITTRNKLEKIKQASIIQLNIPIQSQRFSIHPVQKDLITTDVPPPCAYEPQNNLSPQGRYVLSKNVSAGKRTFMDGRRTSFTDIAAKRSFTPGPGNYKSPSDFGYYDSKKQRYMRLSKSQMSTRQKKLQISAQTNFTNNKQKIE